MIYILDKNLRLSAEMLDDKSLEKQIKGIAQVLCNVHREIEFNNHYMKATNIPLKWAESKTLNAWTEWAIQARANYLWLVNYGIICWNEGVNHRKSLSQKTYKLIEALNWAKDNVPDLSQTQTGWEAVKNEISCSTFPLIMPKQYLFKRHKFTEVESFGFDIIKSYRNFYQAKLKIIYEKDKNIFGTCFKIPWTNRSKPEWLNL